MNGRMKSIAIRAIDCWMAVIPRVTPDSSVLQGCKIVSHRGEHDNKEVMENPLRAYDIARTNGVWGVEVDIRWTADLVPVVCHDPDGGRVFGNPIIVGEKSFAELREVIPDIPSLEELIDKFSVNTHLMIELKAEPFPQKEKQKQILKQLLSSLKPITDFHILALDNALFEMVDFLPRECYMPVSQVNIKQMSKASLEGTYGGFGGHFLLMTDEIKQRHESIGQNIATGFVASRNSMFRELNRGVDWVFSNHAVKLQEILERYR